jgi:formate hydrogenlyase transcriptional activator
MPDANSSIVVLNQPFATAAALTQTLPSEGVLEALKMILSDAPLNDVLHNVALLIEAQTEGMVCTIFLLDKDGVRLRYAAGPSLPDAYRVATDGVPIGPEVGSCGAAAFLRKPVFVSDVLTHPHFAGFRDLLVQVGLRAAWSSPIMSHDDNVLGTFGMYNREVRYPSAAEMQLIDQASRIAGIAIERHRAEQKLREDERELRRTIDAIPQEIVVQDPDGTTVYVNHAVLDYTGLTMEDVIASDFRARIFHPEDLESLREKRRAALARGLPFEIEQRALGKDGQYHWFLIRYNPFRDEQGRVVRWYAGGTDIEGLKQTESLLKIERDRLRLLLDVQQALVANLDLSSLFASLAARLREVTGCDLIGLSLPDATNGQLRQRMVNYREGKGLITEGLIVPLYGTASGKAFRTRELVYMDGSQGENPDPEIYDTPEGKRFYQLLLKEGVPSGYFLPLVHKGEAIAVLQLTKYAGAKFKTQQADFLKALADQLAIAVANALEHGAVAAARDQLACEQVYLREEIERTSMFEEIVGSSEALRRVLEQVSRVAPTDSTVLIQGETGTGKELIARAIHNRSKRSSRAFIRVNCAAIPASLIASELFGYEKGAFTGATQRRVGRFESANGGTIFLDEVGELPQESQVALLRVLQEREFERIGGNQSIHVDVRVLAATNSDLSAAVSEGAFREDLFYRLNVFPIEVPPLRNRAGDIPLLVEYLVERYAQKAGKKIRYVSRETLDLFQNYEWPGNIRELQNVIERAVILSEGDIFSVDATWLAPARSKSSVSSVPLSADLAKREKAAIEEALRETKGLIGGSRGAAAKLGVPRQTLESKIRKLGIDRYRFKSS